MEKNCIMRSLKFFTLQQILLTCWDITVGRLTRLWAGQSGCSNPGRGKRLSSSWKKKVLTGSWANPAYYSMHTAALSWGKVIGVSC
jgi:hypothetical protein